MPSLLILCEYATLNGGERSMLSTLPGIARAGYEITVAAPTAGPLAVALRDRGVEVVPFSGHDMHGVRLPIEVRRRRLAEILRAHRPALLHANSLAMGRLAGPVAAELGVPSISHLRDIVTLSRQYVADLNRQDRLLAVSEATRRFHVAQGITADKIHVLYNGVDTEQFHPAPPTFFLHDELGIPRDWLLLATIGQISLRKGHDVAATALSLLRDLLPSPASRLREDGRGAGGEGFLFAWLVIGQRYSDKAESREFERQLRELTQNKLPGRVFFLGDRGDIARILPELALLVHPARQEPLGRVLLEAAVAGRAIVATDVGGTREMFPSEIDAAALVPPDDPLSMARAIGDLLCDPQRRLRLGENARQRITSLFTIERAVAGLLGHYERVVATA